MSVRGSIDISEEQLGEICRRYRVRELALFGSVLRDDFSAPCFVRRYLGRPRSSMQHERLYLHDVIEASDRVARFVVETERASFLADPEKQRAVAFQLMVIGEAIRNLSDELKSRYPDVAWSNARNLRNLIAHHYFSIVLGKNSKALRTSGGRSHVERPASTPSSCVLAAHRRFSRRFCSALRRDLEQRVP